MNATKYEIINKETGETSPVTGLMFGADTIDVNYIHDSESKWITFSNKDKQGNLTNDLFAIREIETNAQPDGTGTISDMGIATE